MITKSELAEIRDRKSPPKPNEAPVEVFLENASNEKGLQLQTVTKMLARYWPYVVILIIDHRFTGAAK